MVVGIVLRWVMVFGTVIVSICSGAVDLCEGVRFVIRLLIPDCDIVLRCYLKILGLRF